MKVKDYMTKNIVTVSPENTVKEVIELIEKTGHSSFPVLKNGKLVGIITSKDIIKAKPENKVKDIMTKDVVVTYPDVDLLDAARVMFRLGVSKLPVIDRNTKNVVGIITYTDIVRSQIERVTPDKVKKIAETIKKLHGVDVKIITDKVPVNKLIPTQDHVYLDELKGRMYEIEKGLAEPIVVIKLNDRYLLVDGHHRALAAYKLGIKKLDAYVLILSRRVKLGLERTAEILNLKSIEDIKIESIDIGICEIIRGE